MSRVRTRPLQRGDIATCVALHLAAFPNFFLSQLGPRFLSVFYGGYLDDPDAIAAVAVTDAGRVVGVVVGTRRPDSFFARLLRRRLLAFVWASILTVARRPTTAPRLIRAVRYRGGVPLRVEGALLSSICVDPDHQSSGVGQVLSQFFADSVRQLGMGAYLTTDATNNDVVNRFYVRNGWTLLGSFVTPEGRAMNCYSLPKTPPEGQASPESEAVIE